MSTFAIDFDGVIHDYNPKWAGNNQELIGDKSIKGSIDGIKMLLEEHNVFIFTARKDLQRVMDWFIDKGITCKIIDEFREWNEPGVLGITNLKLPAQAYIDDRAVRFTNWNDMLKLLTFKC